MARRTGVANETLHNACQIKAKKTNVTETLECFSPSGTTMQSYRNDMKDPYLSQPAAISILSVKTVS